MVFHSQIGRRVGLPIQPAARFANYLTNAPLYHFGHRFFYKVSLIVHRFGIYFHPILEEIEKRKKRVMHGAVAEVAAL